MERPFNELLVAFAAGDSLTRAELARLKRHQASIAEADDELPTLVQLFGGLKTKDAEELRRLVRQLATQLLDERANLGAVIHDVLTNRLPRSMKSQLDRSAAGRRSGAARRKTSEELLRTVEAIRTQKPTLKGAAAVRAYLKQHDPAWRADTDRERDKRVEAVARRLRRARKNPDTNGG